MCRDYVYVQDVVRVLYWFMVHLPGSGVYDVGSGFARTEEAVARAIFHAMKQEPVILYRTEQRESGTGDNPIFQPDLSRLRRTGYKKPFYSIEKGVKSYIQRYLEE
jgi:ADP-L-glycero-D-manno-heptose 6-epimerase